MPLWATLTIVILSSGLLGTVVGALMQSRRERKRAVHGFAMTEITEFANAAPGWFDLVDAAIRGRDEGGESEDADAAFHAADDAVDDAGRFIARLVIAAGGSKTKLAEVAIGLVSFLELALAELRDWPPEVDDDAVGDTQGMSQEERDREYDFAFESAHDDAIAEARMLLAFAQEEFGRTFTPAAVRHLDPKVLDRAREIVPTLPASVVHPVRTQRRKAQQRRALAEHRAELERLREEHTARAARARAAIDERASSDAATD